MPPRTFTHVTYPQPHASRGREILSAHPELRSLAGPLPQSALWTAALVIVQMLLAWLVAGQPWYVWLPSAYLVGATIDHGLLVLIHECSHNLVFRSRRTNRYVALLANIPLLVPGAMTFCTFHLLHHRHLGEPGRDPDLASAAEAQLVGHSMLRKATWMALLSVTLALRPLGLRRVALLDRWVVLNIVSQVVIVATCLVCLETESCLYLFASVGLSISLHPFGARWIQEHYVVRAGQETYSYYGFLNLFCFNAGYHNEHHDLVTVPWAQLPAVRAQAREFYDDLHAHHSWCRLLLQFLVDRNFSLFNRIVRSRSST
jgi:sphingolipid delta-4 desaturase